MQSRRGRRWTQLRHWKSAMRTAELKCPHLWCNLRTWLMATGDDTNVTGLFLARLNWLFLGMTVSVPFSSTDLSLLTCWELDSLFSQCPRQRLQFPWPHLLDVWKLLAVTLNHLQQRLQQSGFSFLPGPTVLPKAKLERTLTVSR